MLEVAQQVNETEAAAEQEHADGEHRRGAPAHESLGRQVEDGWKRKAEKAARQHEGRRQAAAQRNEVRRQEIDHERVAEVMAWVCLLYTSDAADDLLCVDLGG